MIWWILLVRFKDRGRTHGGFFGPILVPLSLIRLPILFPLKKWVLSMFSAPPPSLLVSQTLWLWRWLLLCAGFSVSVLPILLPPWSFTWCSHSLSSSPYLFISLLIPISSYSLLYVVHSHGSQTYLFIRGVTPCSCNFMSLSLFRNVGTSKSQTAAPLLQKLLSYSFFSTTILSQLLWYKILKLVLISFPFLPFMFVSVYLHTN